MARSTAFKGIAIATVSIIVFATLANTNFATTYSVSNVTLTVNEDGSVNVLQSIRDNTAASITVKAFSADTYDVIATSGDGDLLAAAANGSDIVIDALGADKINLSYSADDLITHNSEVWRLSFTSDNDIQVVLPSTTDIMYISDIPLYEDGGIVLMPAGRIEIDYVMKGVMVQNFLVSSSGNNYVVQASSAAKIEDFRFAQNEGISFMLKEEVPVTVTIPKALLDGPFTVLLNSNSIIYSEYTQNSTHRSLMIDPNDVGTLKLMGERVMPVESVDVRVVAKKTGDLVLIRVTNASDGAEDVYGITVLIRGAGIEAFKGPRDWSRSGAALGSTESHTIDDPIMPGAKAVFKLKMLTADDLIQWKVYNQKSSVIDQGEVKVLSRR